MADHAWKKKGTTIWQFKCEHKGRKYQQSLRTTDKRIAKAEATRLHLQILEGTYRSPAEIKRAEKLAERKIIESPTVRECYERYAREELDGIEKDLIKYPRAKVKLKVKIQRLRSILAFRYYFPDNLKISTFTHDNLLEFADKLNNYQLETSEEYPCNIENIWKFATYKLVKRKETYTSYNQKAFTMLKAIINRCHKYWNVKAPDILPSPDSTQSVYRQLDFENGLRFYDLMKRESNIKPKHISKELLVKSFKIIEEKNPYLCDLLLFQFFTGCRIANAVGLQWQDIDWDNHIITMEQAKGPINHSYTIPITSQLFALLTKKKQERLENNINNMYVFNYKLGKFGTACGGYRYGDYKQFLNESVHRSLKQILQPHDINWTTHQLRHTAAAALLSSGATLKHVQEQLGHADIKTTMIYGHLDKSELAKKMSKGIDEYTNQKSVRNTVLNQNTKTAKLL